MVSLCVSRFQTQTYSKGFGDPVARPSAAFEFKKSLRDKVDCGLLVYPISPYWIEDLLNHWRSSSKMWPSLLRRLRYCTIIAIRFRSMYPDGQIQAYLKGCVIMSEAKRCIWLFSSIRDEADCLSIPYFHAQLFSNYLKQQRFSC